MNGNTVEQNLSQQPERPGGPFIMNLFFREYRDLPDSGEALKIMEKYLGQTEVTAKENNVLGFAAEEYEVQYKDGKAPPLLMITECTNEPYETDELESSQFWDCRESAQILAECKYRIIAADMLAGGMDYKKRADMLIKYLYALMEMFTECEAVIFENSGKMFSKEKIVNCTVPDEDKFIYFAVNVRFLNIAGTNGDMIVDTLGMGTLVLPDLQYHFHGIDPNAVVNHAYNMLSYIYENACPIKNNDSVDGVRDGRMSREVQWKCRYEDSLVQPVRLVIDIDTGEYASGGRDYGDEDNE